MAITNCWGVIVVVACSKSKYLVDLVPAVSQANIYIFIPNTKCRTDVVFTKVKESVRKKVVAYGTRLLCDFPVIWSVPLSSYFRVRFFKPL